MKLNKAKMGELVYELAMEAIEGENYDIITEGGFSDDDFAKAAVSIYKSLAVLSKSYELSFKGVPVSVFALGLSWKVSNNPGYVSCSNESNTGVSRTLAKVVDGIDADDVKNLLDMMNEAYYLMTV